MSVFDQERRIFKSGWVPSNLERYERFWSAMVHGEDWTIGLKYFALYWLTFTRGVKLHFPMFENDAKHPEQRLLEHLTALLPDIQDKLEHISIMQSSNPCPRCAESYIEALGQLKNQFNIDVSITFSSLHKIRRRSCSRDRHGHIRDISEETSETNTEGLKSLKDAGFELKTTDFESWDGLRRALQLPMTYNRIAYESSARKREDDRLKEDLEEILSS